MTTDLPKPLAGPPLGAVTGSQFVWRGDLEDDCSLRVGRLFAHAELMCDDIKCRDGFGEKWNEERWFLGVYVGDPDAETGKDDVVLFHSGEHGGAITSGEMARAIAEAIIRAANDQAEPHGGN